MVNNRMLNRRLPRPRAVGQWLVMGVVVGALLPVIGDAQAPTTVTLKSVLHTVAAGNLLVLTTTEVGPTTSSNAVTIEFLDASDRRRGFATGTLRRGAPVRLRMAVPVSPNFDQIRAIVTFRPLSNFAQSEPLAVLEELDVDSLQVVTKGGVCPVMMEDNSVGGNAEGNCGGWRLTRVAF